MAKSPKASALVVTIGTIGLLLGCPKPAPRQLSGQVFIVTRGKESIKMGLVEVRLYDLRVIEQWLKEIAPSIAASRNRAEELEANAKGTAHSAYTYAKALIDNYRLEDQELIHAAADRADKASELAKAAKAYLQITRSAVPYFFELPKETVASTKTDADGNFTFEFSSKSEADYALIASASRTVPSGEELYFWAVRLPKNSSKVALSNDNLTSVDDKASLLHTIDLDPAFAKALNENIDDLQSRVAKLIATAPAASAKSTLQKQVPAAVAPPPLPEFSPLPPPEFVKLTKDFILVTSRGREVRTLPLGKRLRVIARDQNGITIDSFGERFLIPIEIIEPSK